MVHLVAVLLTLFPGFGTGFLLMRRFRKFGVHFLFSAILASLAAIPLVLTTPRYEPQILSGVAVFLIPLLIWNIYHAHRMQLQVTHDDPGTLAEQERFSRKLALLGLTVMVVLSIVLGILAIPMFLPEKKPEGAGESRHEKILARLDKHHLVHKARLYNRGAESYYHWYDVQPGGYTLELYLPYASSFREVGLIARRIQRYTDDLVYAEGFEVYVLNTQDRFALERLVGDLREHRPDDCIDSEEYGVCGYNPR